MAAEDGGPARPRVKIAVELEQGSGREGNAEDWREVRRLLRQSADGAATSVKSLASASSWKSDKSFVYSRQGTSRRLPTTKDEVAEGVSAVVQAARIPPRNRSPGQLEALTKFLQYNRKLKSHREDDIRELASKLQCARYRPGGVVFIQGDAPQCCYIVLRGSVDIFIKHPSELRGDRHGVGDHGSEDGRLAVFHEPEDMRLPQRSFVSYGKAVEFYGGRVTTLEKTSLFGELALITDSGRSATAVCNRDTLLLQIDKPEFDKLLRQGLARQMLAGEECLEPFECFRGVSKVDLSAVSYCFEEVTFQPRQKLLVQGSLRKRQDPQLLFIAEGTVVELVDPLFSTSAEEGGGTPGALPCTTSSKLLQVSMLHTGSVLGDSTFVEPRVATTFSALSHVKAYRIFKSDMEKRLPPTALAFITETARMKLAALEGKLAQAEQSGQRFGGAQPRRPGHRIPGPTGGVVDNGGSHKAGVSMYQTAKIMHGHDLRRLGDVRPPVPAPRGAAPRLYHSDASFVPPIAVHRGRDLRIAVDTNLAAQQAESTWGDAYYLPGAFNSTTNYTLALAEGSANTNHPAAPAPMETPRRSNSRGNNAAVADTNADATEGAPTFLTRPDGGAFQRPEDAAPTNGSDSGTSGSQQQTVADLMPSLSTGIWAGEEPVLADSLQAPQRPSPSEGFSIDDILADVAAASVPIGGPANMAGLLAGDGFTHMSARLWRGPGVSVQSLASVEPREPGVLPPLPRRPNARSMPLSRSTGSLRLGELGGAASATPTLAPITTRDARDGRDDIFAALTMGLPLTALANGTPVEVQTLRPRRRDGATRPMASTTETGSAGRPITPSIPGIVDKPVTSRAAASMDATGRADASLASQARRDLRVQQPDERRKLDSNGIDAMHAEAREEYGYRAAYCTNYLTHYNPRLSLWELGHKAQNRSEGNHGGDRDRDRDRGPQRSKSNGGGNISRSMTRSYSVFAPNSSQAMLS
eukprot:jgi/Tetstr1/443360/TSEL_031375.t1